MSCGEFSHSFAARYFAHLYVVGGRQHSMGAVAEMQKNVEKICKKMLKKYLLNSRNFDGIIVLMKSTGIRAIKPPIALKAVG